MQRRELKFTGRFPQPQQQRRGHCESGAARRGGQPVALAAVVQRNEKLPFIPPEDWYEPAEERTGYRVIVRPAGAGFRHILTPADVRQRLSVFPDEVIELLEVVQFSQMTRKKQSFPCYGMQWGSSLYLYPIEENLVEFYHCPPTPNQLNEARMYGGRWAQEGQGVWRLEWTEAAVHDFYLNNILIHELGHLVQQPEHRLRRSRAVRRVVRGRVRLQAKSPGRRREEGRPPPPPQPAVEVAASESCWLAPSWRRTYNGPPVTRALGVFGETLRPPVSRATRERRGAKRCSRFDVRGRSAPRPAG